MKLKWRPKIFFPNFKHFWLKALLNTLQKYLSFQAWARRSADIVLRKKKRACAGRTTQVKVNRAAQIDQVCRVVIKRPSHFRISILLNLNFISQCSLAARSAWTRVLFRTEGDFKKSRKKFTFSFLFLLSRQYWLLLINRRILFQCVTRSPESDAGSLRP